MIFNNELLEQSKYYRIAMLKKQSKTTTKKQPAAPHPVISQDSSAIQEMSCVSNRLECSITI